VGACEVESRLVRPDSSLSWIHLAISLVRDEGGEPEFLVAAIEDISGRKQAEDEAGHDPLTGLLNRRGVQERLERELDRAANTGGALTVTLLDLEGFDSLSERLGHQEGERCLQRVGQALREVCRPGDAVGRVGENGFLLAMPGLERDPAIALLRRVKARIAKLAANEGWPIGCSCGSASRLRDGATAESLVKLAGARMTASRTGRRAGAA
ncbi:MAG: diguanylate cyclase domain protein, partial [Alphaproteobacteria bacterium]|nr:diguanylate cyclase domain protein [Alphaproteobacteria bacterium]